MYPSGVPHVPSPATRGRVLKDVCEGQQHVLSAVRTVATRDRVLKGLDERLHRLVREVLSHATRGRVLKVIVLEHARVAVHRLHR